MFSTLLLEIEKGAGAGYLLRAHVVSPGSYEHIRVGDGGRSELILDRQELRACENTPEYRAALTRMLLGNSAFQNGWTVAITLAESRNLAVRVRVNLHPEVRELHTIRWELLGASAEIVPPLCGKRFSISRFFPRVSPRALRDPAPQRLRVVVAVANPRTHAGRDLNLPPIDVSAQVSLARQLFQNTRLTLLHQPGEATLDRIVQAVDGGCDILYLVCHGTHEEDRPKLYLASPSGPDADIVDANLFSQRITSLITLPPRLITFASCQSGGGGKWSESPDDGFLSAVAPRLLDQGVPAVIGMQGSVTQDTAQKYYETFFAELLRDGQIEGAASVSSLAVQNRPDCWMPTLLLSIESGRLWNREMAAPAFPAWARLLQKIRANKEPIDRGDKCTLILGSEIINRFSNGEFARYLVHKYSLPLEAREGEELARVTQYVKISQGESTPGDELRAFLEARAGDNPAMPAGFRSLPTSSLMTTWGDLFHQSQSVDPYAILARLPFPLIVTTNADNLMADALRRANKEPRVECCPWRDELFVPDPAIPTDFPIDKPLLYHLFGHFDNPESIALTEDDFFDHLIWLSQKRSLIPSFLLKRLCNSNLLFLGFRLQDWEFRVLQRTIAKLGGSRLLQNKLHVAVQIDLADTGGADPREIRDRLERIFGGSDFRLNIFWGTVEEFVEELGRQWGAS